MVKLPVDLYWNRIHLDQESKSNYAKNYPKLRKKIQNDALANKDCPLSKKEKNLIKVIQFKNYLKSYLQFFNMKFFLNKFIRINQ